MNPLGAQSRLRTALWLVCLASGGLACSEKRAANLDPRVVAWVNREVISRVDFETELASELGAPDGVHPQSPDQVDSLKQALLQTMIDRTLLLQVAKDEGLVATPEEVERRLMRMSADYPAEGFDQALANGQLSLAQLKKNTAALVTTEKVFTQKVYPRVAVTEEEIRQAFDKDSAAFQEPEKVRAAQIVVKGLDDARKVQRELNGGKKFPDLARKYSLSADAKVGGDLGFFARGVMPPAFDQVVFTLEPGQVSDVVETDYGFHLFKVLERKPARKKDLSEVRAKVEQTLLQQKRAQMEKAYLESLRKKAEIRINEPLLQTLTGKNA